MVTWTNQKVEEWIFDIKMLDCVTARFTRVAKSDLNSTEAYFATKNQHQKMAQK